MKQLPANILVDGKEAQHMLDDIEPVKERISQAKSEIQHIFYDDVLRNALIKEGDSLGVPTPPNEKTYDHVEEQKNMMLSNSNTSSTAVLHTSTVGFGIHKNVGSAENPSETENEINPDEEYNRNVGRSRNNSNFDQYDDDMDDDEYDNNTAVSDIVNVETKENTEINAVEPETMLTNADIELLETDIIPDENKIADETQIIDMEDIDVPFAVVDQHKLARVESSISTDLVLYPPEKSPSDINLGDKHLTQMRTKAYTLLPWAKRTLTQLRHPSKMLDELYIILLELEKCVMDNIRSETERKPYGDESPMVMYERWHKIIGELYNADGNKKYDCSKIPDVFDSCRYDLLHNRHILRKINLTKLWSLTEILAGFVIPQEYGLSRGMKQDIGKKICKTLFQNIGMNIQQQCLRNVSQISRAFLYFTSESYLHALRNALILSDIPANVYVQADVEGMECSYFSHCVIRIYEDPECDRHSHNRFYVAVSFSPGAHANPLIDAHNEFIPVEKCGILNGRYPLNKFLKFLEGD